MIISHTRMRRTQVRIRTTMIATTFKRQDNHMTFTLNGESHLDDEELEPDNGVQDESEQDSCGNEIVQRMR